VVFFSPLQGWMLISVTGEMQEVTVPVPWKPFNKFETKRLSPVPEMEYRYRHETHNT
jgi:hypothetical protein